MNVAWNRQGIGQMRILVRPRRRTPTRLIGVFDTVTVRTNVLTRRPMIRSIVKNDTSFTIHTRRCRYSRSLTNFGGSCCSRYHTRTCTRWMWMLNARTCGTDVSGCLLIVNGATTIQARHIFRIPIGPNSFQFIGFRAFSFRSFTSTRPSGYTSFCQRYIKGSSSFSCSRPNNCGVSTYISPIKSSYLEKCGL